ncbi:MAG: 3-deoxy-manno-octulosonate cytidylyltransferase [Neomegalonema sp.]|nr:3-deoxy-manno-octulosonate cytidylyltransferase [Neomegalonema sp.]
MTLDAHALSPTGADGRAVIVIPARYASQRYPGKPLVPLKGAKGAAKSLIQRSWEAAQGVSGVSDVYVATDDDRIAEHAAAFGAKVLITSEKARNGTERCAECLAVLEAEGAEAPELIVNLQGDAPLTPTWFVEELIAAMRADPRLPTATPGLRCDGASLSKLKADRRAGLVGGTTVVFDAGRRALYFSKEVTPYTVADYPDAEPTPVFHHVGLYAYRPWALAAYMAAPPCELEKLEGLEQLRFLFMGLEMRVVEVEARGRVFWELNNPVDVERVEAALAAAGLE